MSLTFSFYTYMAGIKSDSVELTGQQSFTYYNSFEIDYRCRCEATLSVHKAGNGLVQNNVQNDPMSFRHVGDLPAEGCNHIYFRNSCGPVCLIWVSLSAANNSVRLTQCQA